ncbi:MAG: SDR family oxidoreductase [Saprospiraceae bacterium]
MLKIICLIYVYLNQTLGHSLCFILMLNYLVIGGSSGIGRQLSLQLAHSGHRVFATYNKHTIESFDPLLEYHACNVLDEKLQFDYLPDTLDGFVYCPGSIHLKPFSRISPKEFVADFELQLVGAVKVLQCVLPQLKNSKAASIVLFSSIAVQNGFNFHTQVASSKGAVEGLAKSLAAELAPGIRVNCIAPSLTDTPLASSLLNTPDKRETNAVRHPLKKIGSVYDLANIAEFLLSEKSAWITGQIFHVDGGLSTLKA